MNTTSRLSRISGLILIAAVAQACDLTPASAGGDVKRPDAAPVNPSAHSDPTLVDQPSIRATVVNTQVVLTLATTASTQPTDEQALEVLKQRCAACHNSQHTARMNLAILPSAAQWTEVKSRIELDIAAPGHMPLGAVLEATEKARLGGWLDAQIAPATDDAFYDYKVEVKTAASESAILPLENLGHGRYAISLGPKTPGELARFEVTVTGADQIPSRTSVTDAAVPSDGVIYKTITLAPRDASAPSVSDPNLRASHITDETMRISWTAASDDRPANDLSYTLYRSDSATNLGEIVTGAQPVGNGFFADITGLIPSHTYFFNVLVKDRTGNQSSYQALRVATPGPVDAHLDLRVMTTGAALVADTTALDILRTNCQSCHNPQNLPRWDLTILPLRAYWSEIARRINLSENVLGHMPMGTPLASDKLATLNRWLTEQQNPTDALSGYSLRAFTADTHTELNASTLTQGRTRIALGLRRPGDSLIVNVVVTGPDAIDQVFPQRLTIAADGAALGELTVAPRDTAGPTIVDGVIKVSGLSATAVTLGFQPATDDRPAQDLRYLVYQSKSDKLDSLDDIEANGTRIGADLSATQARPLSLEAVGLEAAHTYYFNIIVSDRTGNRAVYQKLAVLTLPLVLCDEIAASGSIRTWRDDLAQRLERRSIRGVEAADQINRCFPQEKPECVQRTLSFAQKDDIALSGSDGTLVDMPQKRPPDEIIDPVSGNYWIPDNIEEIARDKGWTAVRYKSRHAGGFDPGTPNLLMVYVPGDKVNPPVKFDRWLNFPLPKDDDEPALGSPQRPRPKFGPPRREEYARSNDFPSTFTMVSQDRAENGKPATVYFQMFSRGGGAAFTPGGAVGMRGCVSCHPNGLRAISPLGYHVREGEERLPDEDWKAVELINRMMVEGAGFKASAWGTGRTAQATKPLYRAERGPIMGPTVPVNGVSRTRAFILGGTVNGQTFEGCYKRVRSIEVADIFSRRPGMYAPTYKFALSAAPQINPDKVIAAMACEGCHVNGQRWPLTEDTGMAQVQFKILVDQSMPLGMHMNPLDPGNDTGHVVDQLTPDERFALANCLEAEFNLEKANLAKWMKQVDCQQ